MSTERSDAAVRKSEFARLMGWKPSYVTQLVKEGRVVLNDGGWVLVEASRRRLAETTAGSHAHVTERHAAARGKRGVAAAELPALSGDGAAAAGLSVSPLSTENPADALANSVDNPIANTRPAIRKAREIVIRETRLIELGLLKGQLVERAAVNHLWHDIGVAVRAHLDAMIERLSARVSGCASADEIRREVWIELATERRSIKRLLVNSLRQMRRAA